MFVLRSKVRIADLSESWVQYGIWQALLPASDVTWDGEVATVRVDAARFLRIAPSDKLSLAPTRGEEDWTLEEIRAGRPLISAATQDQFVPQMVNFEALGAIDFQKGCYPGQEIVARAQYRGQVKRRLVHVQAPAGTELKPGQEFNGGVVVDSARSENGSEALAVMPF
jgi:folate-binding protein YgfZ